MKKREAIKKKLEDNTAIEVCAREFDVVGDPTRLKVCYLLCREEELPVGEMAELTGVSISTVSRALKKLEGAGVVERRRDFRHVYYRFTETPLADLVKERLE